MNVFDYITQQQLSQIIETIKNCCVSFQKYQSIFYEPYITMRQKHALTAAVLSGFAPDRINIDGFTVENINYGLHGKMSQPELHSENAIIQIYSDGSTLNNKPIKSRCREYNQNMNPPIFFVVQFSVNQNQNLESVNICFFDSNARQIETQNVY